MGQVVSDYSQTVTRAVAVLDSIRQAGAPVGVQEIARRTGLSPAQAHRILVSLKLSGILQQMPDSRSYWLGWKLVDYAHELLRSPEMRPHALPLLLRLRDLTGESAIMFIPAGRDRVCSEEVESLHDIRRQTEIGARYPLHAGAAGRAILAFLDPVEVEYVLDPSSLRHVAPNTVTDRYRLLALLEETRRSGIARSHEEMAAGVAAIATPFFRADGAVAGSISIAGPAFRCTPKVLSSFASDLLAAGLELSRRLGFQADPPWIGSTADNQVR